MAKLSAKERAALKPSQFGLPDKARTKSRRARRPGTIRCPTEGHAISAIRLAKKNRKAGNLSKSDYNKIRRKAHKMLKKD